MYTHYIFYLYKKKGGNLTKEKEIKVKGKE